MNVVNFFYYQHVKFCYFITKNILCVSFQAVPAEFQNGENFHYVVHFHIYHVSSSRTIRESDPIIVGNKTLYSFPHLDSHSAYIFRIYAVNSMGRSMNSSHVIIDKSDKCKFCIYSFLGILLVCYSINILI